MLTNRLTHEDSDRIHSVDGEEWGIAKTAEHFDITPRTLRFYEDKGLISPMRIGGKRVFSNLCRARLDRILRAKRIGFSLEDIKQFLDVADGLITNRQELEDRYEKFTQVINRLENKKYDLEKISHDMQELCVLIEGHLQEHEDNNLQSLADAYQARLAQHLDDD